MRLLASNLRTFAIALVLGVSVWISAVTSADPDEVRLYPNTVPLEIVGQDPSLIITSEVPTTVDVSLRAPRSVWEQLTALERSVQATLDLTGLSAGEHRVEIEVRYLVRPAQVVLTNPASVTVNLERLAQRTLPLELSLVGQTAIGYQAGDVTIEPSEIVISGPESIVRKAAEARVRVSLDGARENIDQTVNVQIVDEANNPLNGLTLTPASVRATVPISQQGGFRDVAVKVVVTGQIAAGYRLENISVFPPIVTVFASEPELVNALPGVVETQPLDLQDAREDFTARLALVLPEDITIVGAAQTVQVTVGISPIQTSLTLLNQSINVIGLSEGLTAQVFPQTVDVIISGPLPGLDALTPQDVIVTVDVTGLTPGTYQLNPKVEVLVDNVLVESILPGTVEVVISIAPTPTRTPRP
jgi:YbbR domain-containing protein